MFKVKNKVYFFSYFFCIICNMEIEFSEYVDWVMEMGAFQGFSNLDGVYFCFYVYIGNQTNGPDTLLGCKLLVCGGNVSYNDMVGKNNGNFNLGFIFNIDLFVVEEWILLDDVNLQSSMFLD